MYIFIIYYDDFIIQIIQKLYGNLFIFIKHLELEKNVCRTNEYLDLEIPRALSEMNMKPIDGSDNIVNSLIQLNLIVSPYSFLIFVSLSTYLLSYINYQLPTIQCIRH